MFKHLIDFVELIMGWSSSKPGTSLTSTDNVTRLRDEQEISGPTVVYIKCHSLSQGTRLAERAVSYDPWGVPSVQEPLWNERLELRPRGETAYFIGDAEWKHKSGPPVRFPTEAERRSFFPNRASR